MNKLVENAYMKMIINENENIKFVKKLKELMGKVDNDGKKIINDIIKLHRNDNDDIEQLDLIASKLSKLNSISDELDTDIHDIISYL